jgi:hypothetical protein
MSVAPSTKLIAYGANLRPETGADRTTERSEANTGRVERNGMALIREGGRLWIDCDFGVSECSTSIRCISGLLTYTRGDGGRLSCCGRKERAIEMIDLATLSAARDVGNGTNRHFAGPPVGGSGWRKANNPA